MHWVTRNKFINTTKLYIINNLISFLRFHKEIVFFLNKKEKKNFNLLVFFQIFIMILEMIGIGLIFPILKIITDKNFLADNTYLNQLKFFLNIDSSNFGYLLLLLLIIFLFLKNFIIIIFITYKSKIVYSVLDNIRSKLFKNYLNQDYSFFVKKTPSKMIKNVQVESVTVMRAFDGLISTYSELFLMIGSITILLLISFKITIYLIIFFILFGFLFLKFFRTKLKNLGAERQELDHLILLNLQNGLFSFKELFFYNCKTFFLENFNLVSKKLKINLTINSIIGQSIRIAIEQIAIIIASTILIILLLFKQDIKSYIPIIGAIFYAFFRILPSFNKLILNIQLFLISKEPINILTRELNETKHATITNNTPNDKKNFVFKNKIIINNLSFSFDNLKILDDINLEIKKTEKIGIIGKTGSGKSTLLNILMGLIYSNYKGTITIDELNLKDIRNEWFSNIGYVSQDNILLDYSIIENITYEKDLKKINEKKYFEAISDSRLENLINDFKNRENLKLGNKGISISGGEAQRIALARALYKDSQVLVLDEFTSSLDSSTEKNIIENLSKLNKTMIIVSHKLSSLTFCDRVYEIQEGKLKEINVK